MDKYRVVISPQALDDIRSIYSNDTGRWSRAETDAYVDQILDRCDELEEIPHRISFDEHTRIPRTFRSFEHKAHKIFFTIYEDTKVVDVIAILPSRTNYSSGL